MVLLHKHIISIDKKISLYFSLFGIFVKGALLTLFNFLFLSFFFSFYFIFFDFICSEAFILYKRLVLFYFSRSNFIKIIFLNFSSFHLIEFFSSKSIKIFSLNFFSKIFLLGFFFQNKYIISFIKVCFFNKVEGFYYIFILYCFLFDLHKIKYQFQVFFLFYIMDVLKLDNIVLNPILNFCYLAKFGYDLFFSYPFFRYKSNLYNLNLKFLLMSKKLYFYKFLS